MLYNHTVIAKKNVSQLGFLIRLTGKIFFPNYEFFFHSKLSYGCEYLCKSILAAFFLFYSKK